jgi:hypothetical protein
MIPYIDPPINGIVNSIQVTKLNNFPCSSGSTHLERIERIMAVVIAPNIWIAAAGIG